VSDGLAASFLLEKLLCRPEELRAEERGALPDQLRAYCNHDTAVMVKLFRFLQEAAARAGQSPR
jgi:hypothetical protein